MPRRASTHWPARRRQISRYPVFLAGAGAKVGTMATRLSALHLQDAGPGSYRKSANSGKFAATQATPTSAGTRSSPAGKAAACQIRAASRTVASRNGSINTTATTPVDDCC